MSLPTEDDGLNLHHGREDGWTMDGQTEPEEGGSGGGSVASTQEQKQQHQEEQKLSVLPSMTLKGRTKASRRYEDGVSIKPVQVEEQLVEEVPPSLCEEQSLLKL